MPGPSRQNPANPAESRTEARYPLQVNGSAASQRSAPWPVPRWPINAFTGHSPYTGGRN